MRRGIRLIGRVVFGLLILLLVAAAGLWLALNSRSVRQSLLGRLGRAVEERTGLELRVADFSLRPTSGEIELRELSLGRPGEAAAVEVSRLRLDLGLGSLLSKTLVVQDLEVEKWRVNLDQLLELSPAERAGDAPVERRFEIRELELADGSIQGGPLPEPLAAWLGGWSARGIGVRGAYVGGRLTLDLRQATVVLAKQEGETMEVTLAGTLEGPQKGPFRLDRLTLAGGGLDGEVSGILGLQESQPLEVAFRLAVEPGWLLGLAEPGGHLEAAGEVDLRSQSGRIHLAGSELSARLLSPWLGETVPAPLDPQRDRLRLAADLTLGPESFTRVAGRADLSWLRGAETVATARLESIPPGETVEELRLALRAELFPELAGSRRFAGRLRLPDVARVAEAELEEGRWSLTTADLASDLKTLRSFWPGLLPARVADFPLEGELAAQGQLEGRLADLLASAELDWHPGDGSSVSLRAEGHPRQLDGRAEIVFTDVEVSRWVSAMSGRISGHGRGGASKGSWEAAIELAGSNLGAAGGEAWLDDLSLELRTDGRRIVVDSMQGMVAGRARLVGKGDLALSPDVGGKLRLRTVEALGAVEEAELEVDLRGGTLSAEGRSRLANGADAVVQLSLPLASVAHIEQLAAALSLLPQKLDQGLLSADWRVSESDWRAVLADLGHDPGMEIRAGLAGHLELDPADPAAGLGEMRLSGLAFESEGQRWAAPQPWLLRLAEGVLQLQAPDLDLGGGPGWLEADVPVASLAALWPAVERFALQGAEGPVEVRWSLPPTNWRSWIPAPGDEPFEGDLWAGLEGHLTVDPAAPTAAQGELILGGLALSFEGHRTEAASDLRLRLSDGRLELEPFSWLADGQTLDVAGSVELDPDWQPSQELRDAVRALQLSADGILASELLSPYLGGGIAEGPLSIRLAVDGTLEELEGRLAVQGPEARLFFPTPYATRIERLELELEIRGGEARVRSGRVRLNEGEVELGGKLKTDGTLALRVDLKGVRYYLDYGLLVTADGSLTLARMPAGRSRLSGDIVVDRGVLNRPIELDLDFLARLLAPIDLTGTETSPLDDIELNLNLTTRHGVRVSNNLAEMLVRWEPISVRGTLARPLPEGKLEVEPGGRIYAYGQTVRLDAATLIYSGRPDELPRLDLETTSSLEDPSIGRLRGLDPLLAGSSTSETRELGREVTTGLATFYGEQLVSRLSESLGRTRLSLEPIPIFGEVDPGARLTLSRDFSANASVAASVDLRSAESQTYLLDLHDFRGVPKLKMQLFTNDEEQEG
ncbi:MAG: translocation/assembly module TamB domain-containing protein, partial [Thermoanaerobaculia bacterium]